MHFCALGQKRNLKLLGGLATALVLMGCGEKSGRKQLPSRDSNVATLKIGGFGGDWAKMEVAFESIEKKTPDQKYAYARDVFGSDGTTDASITVVQDKYYIGLVYFNKENKVAFRNCDDSKQTVHDLVGKKEYQAVIPVCPENSNVPVGEVAIKPSSTVIIKPVAKPQEPGTPTPPNTDENSLLPQPTGLLLPTDAKFWVDPYSQAMSEARNLKAKNDPRASKIQYIADQAAGVWYGPWSGDIKQAVSQQVKGALTTNSWSVMIPYNIPYRDCGQHSAGGLKADEYRRWISDLASAIGEAKTIVVLEPDSLALQRCLNDETRKERHELLKDAVVKLKANKNTLVYLDAGHSNFASVEEIVPRLKDAGVSLADGFALNVSNYETTEANTAYGIKVSDQIGRKSFVIDTSRNGNGPKGDQWCNPRGRALGKKPTANTGVSRVAAYLWLKRPGESDGHCENGNDSVGQNRNDIPAAGAWWLDIAVEQAQNAGIY